MPLFFMIVAMMLSGFLAGCVVAPEPSGITVAKDITDITADISTAIKAREQNIASGFADIDKGDYQPEVKAPIGKKKTDRLDRALSRLDRLLGEGRDMYGDDFDPNQVKAPDYKKARYKRKVSNQILLEELMGAAYDAYKETTGKAWYPRRVKKGVKSGDPLLNPTWWQLTKGDSLHEALARWGRRANWKIVWQSDYQYPIEISAVFRGSFLKSVRRVLQLFESREPQLYATFYKNRVIVFQNGEE